MNSSGALGSQVFFAALASMVAVAVTSEGYYRAAGIQALRKQLLFNTMLSSTLLVFNARTLSELTIGLLLLDAHQRIHAKINHVLPMDGIACIDA